MIDMSAEIQRLQLLERCRKRAAEEPAKYLRRIFDKESTVCWKYSCAASTVAFGEMESSIYKRRRLLLLLLPTDASDVAACIIETRYEMCDGQQIFFADL